MQQMYCLMVAFVAYLRPVFWRWSSLLTIAFLEAVWWVSVGNNRTPQL